MMDFILAESKLLRVGLYFGVLLASMFYILWKAFVVSRSAERVSRKLLVLPLIALFTLIIVWRDIIMFMLELSKNYPDLETMFKEEELLVKAYRVVTDSVEGYWWSSQLLMFTLVFIVFINTKARQISMPILELCAYTCLGFGGAISVAFALFLYRYNVTISMETKRVEHHQMSCWSIAVLAICLWLAFLCIVFLYFSVDQAFKVYLLLTHLTLFLPSLLPSIHVRTYTTTAAKGLIPLLYALLFVALACHQFYFTHLALPDSHPTTFHKLVLSGFAHHSQSGISFDAVMCFVLCIVYLLLKSENGSAVVVIVPFIFLSPCLSLGSTFSLVMLYEEYLLERKIGTKEE
ncbi:hypothetical protein QZH41_019276 [Actinostola sp. cb2023]|nr:hypothetical protein QZH41_019276 [Actinostola sp. cb2023]